MTLHISNDTCKVTSTEALFLQERGSSTHTREAVESKEKTTPPGVIQQKLMVNPSFSLEGLLLRRTS